MPGLTAALARFAAEFDTVPAAAAAVATMGMTDAVGVMLAAGREPVVCAVRDVVLRDAAGGPASVLFSGTRARAVDAAMINATAAHAFAMDDVAWGCHPSAMLMPAILAAGEAIGASGAAALRAYVVGYETLAELASREPDSLHATAWHPTGLLGPVAVAAAIASLMRLPAPQCAHAMAIAASMSGGLQGNFGTPTKAVHAGRASSGGLLAAQLAAAGVTAATDGLEHPKGLLRAVSPAGRVNTGGDLGFSPARLRIMTDGLSIKKYPLCYTTHRIVDAAIAVAQSPGFEVERVTRIEVKIGTRQAAMARHASPRDPFEARYSVGFAVACGLAARAAGFAQLDPGFIASAQVRRLLGATQIELREGVSADDAVFCASDRVIVHLSDDSVLDSGEVTHARGHARMPLDATDLKRKFVDCAAHGGASGGGALFARLADLGSVADLRGIAALT